MSDQGHTPNDPGIPDPRYQGHTYEAILRAVDPIEWLLPRDAIAIAKRVFDALVPPAPAPDVDQSCPNPFTEGVIRAFGLDASRTGAIKIDILADEPPQVWVEHLHDSGAQFVSHWQAYTAAPVEEVRDRGIHRLAVDVLDHLQVPQDRDSIAFQSTSLIVERTLEAVLELGYRITLRVEVPR